jgi:hypothetical protein
MSEFVTKVLAELKSNCELNSSPLIKMIVESAEKSISLNESREKIYFDLKNGLVAINENIKNPILGQIVSSFEKNEQTLDSHVKSIATEAGISKEINLLKESHAYANPVLKTQIDLFESYLNSGSPDFVLCDPFIKTFANHTYDSNIKKSIASVQKYLAENAAKVKVLNAIYQMDSMRTQVYAPVSEDLKKMLVSESYSADVIKIKFGTAIPVINALVQDLRIIESTQYGTFTVGEGNGETMVNNLIAPAIKTQDGILMYADNRFLSIREAKGLTGQETKIHVNEAFKIADLSPEYVKTTYGKFYTLCESYALLGFKKTEDGLGVESNALRGFKMSFDLNEKKEIVLNVNGEKFDSANFVVSESLALETSQNKERINTILENSGNVFHFEFIKEVTNYRTLSEALVLHLNNEYYICEKLNAAEREWNKVNEHQLSQFFTHKFNYDVTAIFKVKIDESIAQIKKIEEQKQTILSDIKKLEESVEKLNIAIDAAGHDVENSNKLSGIKESILSTIEALKKEYVDTDLLKKKVG